MKKGNKQEFEYYYTDNDEKEDDNDEKEDDNDEKEDDDKGKKDDNYYSQLKIENDQETRQTEALSKVTQKWIFAGFAVVFAISIGLNVFFLCSYLSQESTSPGQDCEVAVKPAIWKKVFSHDTAGGLFANLDEAKQKNIDNEHAPLFSTLFNLESMRNDAEEFHFKLCYPELTDYEFPCNEWIQSSNPVTESNITGYAGIQVTWSKNSIQKPFQGLGLSPASFAVNLIDDAPDHSYWWNSIGTLKYHDGPDTIPGPVTNAGKGIVVKRKELYVRYTPSG
eukprot:GFUD01083998.1.p1 GENE.GFUD01083998.1~~GFUD01083998.1.p1  ORF type:complete len:279 (+),score=71.27 GFUD01083998.1:38-874(+)